MRRVHMKGDVLCSLILLLLFCLLLYAHHGLAPIWESWRLQEGDTGSETLLVTNQETFVHQPSKPPDPVQCKSSQKESQNRPKNNPGSKSKQKRKVKVQSKAKTNAAVKKTSETTVGPTPLVPFDFEDYIRKKDNRHFRALLDQPDKCRVPDGSPFLLVAVKSVAEDFDKRQVVRRTWGQEGMLRHGISVKTVFLLGLPKNQTVLPLWDKLLAYESQNFRDILLWDFEDTFFNLTLKETHFLQWVNASCSRVKFIFKGDADVYVNIDNILEMLQSQDPDKDLFVGDIIVHARPIRRRNSKYFVPESVYGQSIYPSYAGGGGFVMSGHTALRLNRACQEVELFPIDDVFLGMCLLRIGLQPTRHEGFRTFGIARPSAAPTLQVFNPCFYRELMVVHSLKVPQIWLMWNLLHDPQLRCHTKQAPTPWPFKWRGPSTSHSNTDDVEDDYNMKVFVSAT
ncbi:UDP-GlcNAc:betaGal beta-1,3-N-acetylglucosaminyltransferase 9 [Denticeps clupeoides]|uniref:Hexosyltransferase n=1 Tax=Denticeps clupeoides TaxID=299321 RepID=A0AAY4ENE1_9TELE|nr:UDP-GlcNAc:betaGal beta-1,3-N-acetylglucosaminyltransferase 9 [Denticeps clupeoides]XP_028813502.1 UDP-GlcNAc:betaGal beta-1,3-N-acetylglucosaminyltransferase 9 [Denticeps clupeoides]